MGIKGLTKLLAEHAPGCVKEQKFVSYLDRKIVIDASMHIYQYLVRFVFVFGTAFRRISKTKGILIFKNPLARFASPFFGDDFLFITSGR